MRETLDNKIKRITRQVMNEELSRNDVENIVSNKVSSKLESSDFQKKIKSIVADTLEELYKTLYNRSSTWKSSIK
jgi:hypothetical protein